MSSLVSAAVLVAVLPLGLSGCASGEVATDSRDQRPGGSSDRVAARATERSEDPRAKAAQPVPGPSPAPDERTMRRATMTIPVLGVRAVRVVPYRGSPDDGPGTRIQNGGVAASPFGDRGGVGPGQIGNYIVTAHRTTGAAPPFADLPSVRRGAHVFISTQRWVFDYRVTGTRWTSFRSQRSLARQSAAVPGHPGRTATQARITLSTCATQEDHAAGNYWADRFDNPEHRIDKVALLVDVRGARLDGAGPT